MAKMTAKLEAERQEMLQSAKAAAEQSKQMMEAMMKMNEAGR